MIDFDDWNVVRVTMSEFERDIEYYIQLVERDKKDVVITRDGKDFLALIPPNFNINKTSEDKSP